MRASERVDRDEVFLEVTRSICPVCKRVLDAEVNARDDQVFLRKRCPEHGAFEARIYGDATMYVEAMRFNKPGTIPLQTQTEVREGSPRLRPMPRSQTTRLPRRDRGELGVQPGLPDLLRGLRPPARRLHAHRRAGRAGARRLRPRRGRAGGRDVLRRRTVDPPADPQTARARTFPSRSGTWC